MLVTALVGISSAARTALADEDTQAAAPANKPVTQPHARRHSRKPAPLPPESRTEYFWEPSAGHVSIEAGASTGSAQYDLKTLGNVTAGSVVLKSSLANMVFRYGLSEAWALNLEWSPIGTVTQDTTLTGAPTQSRRSSGPGDLKLGFLDTIELADIRLHIGLILSAPLTGAKSATPSADGNLSTGGFSLAALFGLSMKVSEAHHFGGKALYRYAGARTSDAQDGTTTSSTGGSDFDIAGFYEFHEGRLFVSPIVEADLIDGSLDTNSGRNSTNDTSSVATLETDLGWQFTSSLVMVAKIAELLKQESKVGSYKVGYSELVAGANIRYEF